MSRAEAAPRRRLVPTPEAFQFLLEVMAEGVVVLTNERRIVYCNQAAADFFGGLALAFNGRVFDDLLDAPSTWPEIFARCATGTRVYGDARIGDREVFVRAGRLERHEMPGGGFLLLIQDVEPLRRSERRLAAALQDLREANRQKSLFLSVVSHDVRSPAAAARSYLQGLLDGLEGPLADGQRTDVEAAVRNIDHLTGLVRDLLEVCRIEAGGIPLAPVEAAAIDLVEGPVERLRPLYREKGVDLVASCAGDLPCLRVDPARIDQVLQNLLSNALKFTPSGGRVEIRAERSAGPGVRFSVADSGPGVPPDEAAAIFDPYRTGARGRTAGGIGLGLAISRGIVEAHGGTIRLESPAGGGAVFVFEIPAA